MAFRLFSGYTKEGPGLYPEDMEDTPFSRYFGVLGRKVWKLMINNLMFVITNIPTFVLSFFIILWFLNVIGFTPQKLADAFIQDQNAIVSQVDASDNDAVVTTETPDDEKTLDEYDPEVIAATYYLMMNILLALMLTGSGLVTMGPSQTALTYLYRNYAREISTFTWGDFKDSFKMNFKDSLKIMFINLLVTIILLVNIAYYLLGFLATGTIATIVTVLFTLVLVVFTCVNIYTYPMLASLELKVKHVYKNSLLFFMWRFFPSLGIFLVNVFLLVVVPFLLIIVGNVIGFLLALVYFLFFGYSLTHYTNTFFVWQQIDKYINRKNQETENPELNA